MGMTDERLSRGEQMSHQHDHRRVVTGLLFLILLAFVIRPDLSGAGQGGDTIGLLNPTTSVFFLKNSNAPGPADLVFGYGPAAAGWIPLAGDWNGDGIDTVGLYNFNTGTFFLRNSNSAGPAHVVFNYGPGGLDWAPIVGDWDGNNTDTVGLLNLATSTFFLKNSNGAGPADLVFTFGPADLVFGFGPAGANWFPLAADWGL